MNNRHNNNLNKNEIDLVQFFIKPISKRQKQYEVVRAIVIEKLPVELLAKKFEYKISTIYSLVRDAKAGRLELFPKIKKGPKKRRTSITIQEKVIQYRKENLSSPDIHKKLKDEGIIVSTKTIERILKDAGFPKLRRRTNKERGISKKGTLIPKRSVNLNLKKLKPFRAECKVAGVFFFLPYIIESGIIEIVRNLALPCSNEIGKQQAALSMLLLKLIGNERLSHIKYYDADQGFGIFAGLNVLPKPTYMCSYSCRNKEYVLMDFQRKIIENFRRLYPNFYQGETINLDFHSIPHFGDESSIEKIWCGSRGKSLRGANTFFAQDGSSDSIIYTGADIKRSESSSEIKNFVDYWLKVKGIINETLIFDSKLTRYDILYELDEDNVKFITVRRKCKSILENTQKISENDWERVYLPIPKRKHKYVKVFQNYIPLIKGKKAFRQIIIKNHGRVEPTYIISNNKVMKKDELLTIYAKRWHIENKLSELVNFFNLNNLSSPVMIRIHFDILWTIIADTLYHLFAQDLRRFENNKAASIFKQFIDMPGQIVYDGKEFHVKIRKRGITPILLGIEKLNKDILVPWLDNKVMKIVWTQ